MHFAYTSNMNKIKTVIFDVGGVLIRQDAGATDYLMDELNIDQPTLESIFAHQIPLLGSGKIDEAEFWRQLQQNYTIRRVDASENLLGRSFVERLDPYTDMLEFIKELSSIGYRLVVLSNTIEAHARELKSAGIYEGFDHLFLSHEIGMRKPDPEIYQHVLTALSVSPQATLFIDDDRKNIEVAVSLGMNGVLFTDEHKTISEIRTALELNS